LWPIAGLDVAQVSDRAMTYIVKGTPSKQGENLSSWCVSLGTSSLSTQLKEINMAKKSNGSDGIYRVIDVIGTSKASWEEAARSAVETASKSLRDLRVAEVTKMDLKVENGKVVAYRTRVQLSFKYEG
jgi:flavin-binding protein dodecin